MLDGPLFIARLQKESDSSDSGPRSLYSSGETFYVNCNLYLQALSALGFGLPERFFELLCNNGDNTLKTMRYSHVPKDLKGVRMMAHTDLEIVTLLLQNSAGGLKLTKTAGEQVKAIRAPGSLASQILYLIIVCNGECWRFIDEMVKSKD